MIGYEGLYEVSDCGLIRSLPRRGTRCKNTRIRSAVYNANGYNQICLSKDGKSKMVYVHRMVAQAFIPNPHNLPEVNHKDENPSNNCVKNLEWCDRAYNNRYGVRTQKTQKAVDMYDLNDCFVRCFESLVEAAGAVCGDAGHISQCCNGKRKTASKYKWRWHK